MITVHCTVCNCEKLTIMINILKTISISDRSPPPIVRRLLQMLINSAAIAVLKKAQISTFVFPNLTKTLGWVGRWVGSHWENFPPKKRFFRPSLFCCIVLLIFALPPVWNMMSFSYDLQTPTCIYPTRLGEHRMERKGMRVPSLFLKQNLNERTHLDL